MNRTTNTSRRQKLLMPAGLLAAAGMAMGLGAVAQAQYQDDRYSGDRYEEHYEWEPGTGVHEEEWWDPTDWFDDDYNERYIDYEELDDRDDWNNNDNDNNVLNDNYDRYYDNGYYEGYWNDRDRANWRSNNRDRQNQRGMYQDRNQRNQYGQRDNNQNRQMNIARVRGEIDGWTRVNIRGQRNDDTLVRVRDNNGRSAFVIVSSGVDLSRLDIRDGDNITVLGDRETINDREFIKARQLRVGNRTIRVSSQGQQWQDSRRDNRSGQQWQDNQRDNRSGQQWQDNQRDDRSGQQWQDRQRDDRSGQQWQNRQRDDRSGQQSRYDQRDNRSGQQWQDRQRDDRYGQQSRYDQRDDRYGQQWQDRQRDDRYGQQSRYDQRDNRSGQQWQDRQRNDRYSQQSSMAPQARQIQQTISQWPTESRRAAEQMLMKYGRPDGIMSSMLVWKDTGPFAKTVVHKDPTEHDFPMSHKQVLEQCVEMDIPTSKAEDIARFDSSLVVYYSDGLVAARCHEEAVNILALNLVDKIVNDDMSVEEARQKFKKDTEAYMKGEDPEMTQQLAFNTNARNQRQGENQRQNRGQDQSRNRDRSNNDQYSSASGRDDD